MIHGAKLKKLNVMADERGRLMELMRCDDEMFSGFGQVYLTTAYPGVVKAWHYHKYQTDNFIVVSGMMKVVLYDMREDSPTYYDYEEFFLGDWNTSILQIPPGVYHGFKCISDREAIVINVPDKPYDRENPDEHRLPFDELCYDWDRKNY